ncbi:MAG: hypothetical protein AAB681_00040 [Patescibacteria group bacterium]
MYAKLFVTILVLALLMSIGILIFWNSVVVDLPIKGLTIEKIKFVLALKIATAGSLISVVINFIMKKMVAKWWVND